MPIRAASITPPRTDAPTSRASEDPVECSAEPYDQCQHIQIPQHDHRPHYNDLLNMSDTPPTIDWLRLGTEAFARAAREDKPILLSLVAPWCEHCAAMDRTTYTRADVARLVDARFVAIRVDTDRSSGHQRAIQPWRMADDGIPDSRRAGLRRRHVHRCRPHARCARQMSRRRSSHRRGEIATRTAAARGSGQPHTPEMERKSLARRWPCSGRRSGRVVVVAASGIVRSRRGRLWHRTEISPRPALTLALERYRDTHNPLLASW